VQLGVQSLSPILSESNLFGVRFELKLPNSASMSFIGMGNLVISKEIISEWAKTLPKCRKIHTSRCPCEGQTQTLGFILAKFIYLDHFWNSFSIFMIFKNHQRSNKNQK